ncbi:cyclin-J18 isoform X2 [Impatiens glandulifera]|uniref:cyclin-J18 isoform X2 n=1 Tax=Impatiens glandulifera TaxID=253017 RepID=UPI001FB17CF3|nr:cyclin-J18 isoform X2 [Impatiens glandulifera]
MESELSSCVRYKVLEFLIQSAQRLEVRPIVKYSALSLFADRFYPSLTRFRQTSDKENWLLKPMRDSNLQLFTLISLWISSKIHESRAISVKGLKSLGDEFIKEQQFMIRDFLEGVIDFNIGTSNIAFVILEKHLIQFKGIAIVGELLNFEACMDIMDLLYEEQELSTLYYNPESLSAAILVVAYVITVPKQKWEFPVLPWVKFISSCKEEDVVEIVGNILKHVVGGRTLSF